MNITAKDILRELDDLADRIDEMVGNEKITSALNTKFRGTSWDSVEPPNDDFEDMRNNLRRTLETIGVVRKTLKNIKHKANQEQISEAKLKRLIAKEIKNLLREV